MIPSLLEGLLGLQVGRPLVQDRGVPGGLDVLHDRPGEPEQVVRGVRTPDEPGPAVLEPVEPVDDVPFQELLRGVQQDLHTWEMVFPESLAFRGLG